MAEKTLLARVREDQENPGTLLVASPVVGLADGRPAEKIFLNPLDKLLSIDILGEQFVLRLPRGKHGRVVEALIPNELTPIEFDQVLLRLDTRAMDAGSGDGTAGAAGAAGGSEDAAADLVTITSPTEGIFYRRSSPEDPPYVEVGSEVSAGTVLGLVEVMKCFNQITYGGPEYPSRAKIAKVLVNDAEELSFGHPLFKVIPIEE